ncbi:MAG TPA: hypothetical protein VIQ31_38345 [Phormidium sp.]
MNTQVPIQKIWFALTLMAGEYVLLGWYLAAHHIFWLIGTFIVILTFAAIWKKNPILDTLNWLVDQSVFVVIGISLLFSLVVAFAFTKPVVLSLSLLPSITLLYALLEMRSSGFKQSDVFFWAVMITGLGLGIGEAIDLFITPSIRY